MIQVYNSNDLNKLTNDFIELINKEKLSPFDSEVVIVQTEGIKKWLSLKIAKINNICLNVRFLTPRNFIYELLKLLGLDFSEEHIFEKNNLFWLVLNILLKNSEEFGNLSAYIKDSEINNKDFNEIKLAQIISVVVDLFDQYFTYRPKLINNWEKGEEEFNNIDEHWQFLLFRKISEKVRVKSFPVSVLEKLNKPPNINTEKYYKRASFFAISVLPPFYLDILYYFAPCLDMYMFLLNPSKDYWYMDISEKVGTRISLNKGIEANKLYYSVKKNLLTDFGNLGKVFFSNLFALSDQIVSTKECFVNNSKPKSMLEIIKNDILLNRDLNEDEKPKVDDNDYSIEIHSCYSPMREVETLYNRLLNIFEKDKNLTPADVLVMTPDISEYAPYIDAVFGNQKNSDKYIPYTISDVNYLANSNIIQIFMDILLLVRGRYTASEIFNLIEFESIRKKFKLNESDIEILRICIEESGIRWGFDRSFREEEGLIRNKLYSWEYGLERLLLSFIYESDEPYNDILIVNGVELSVKEPVSALIEFLNILYEFYLFSKEKHTVGEWVEKLERLVNDVFEEDREYLKDLDVLTSILSSTNRSYKNYEINNPSIYVGIEFVIEYLKKCLTSKRQFHRFLDGNLNFCEMIPMRSIPFDVICIIGLNDDTFPRKRKPLSFDLMAQYPKEGDRDLRENDKYLFLETIISASKKLYLSYVGQDIITNDELPPSVLLSQFLYTIKERFGFSNENLKIEDRLIFKHPLFSFDKKYFLKNAGDIFVNYSDVDYLAALSRSKTNEDVEYKKIFVKPETDIDVKIEENIINIDDLLSFFGNPIQYFFRKTLGINLYDKELIVSDKEPFTLGVNSYKIKTSVIDKHFNHFKEGSLYNIKDYVYKYSSLLPPGGVGSAEIKETIRDAKAFLSQLSNFLDVKERQLYEMVFDFNDYRLEGMLKYFHKLKYSNIESTLLEGLENSNLAYYRPTTIKTKDKIDTWVKHVIFNYFELYNQKKPSRTYYFGYKKEKNDHVIEKIVYAPKDNKIIKEQFAFLIDLYLKGIKKPIHFYSEVSESYFNEKGNDHYKTKFLDFLENNNYGYDKRDVYLALYVKNFDKRDDFFNDEFFYLANTIFNYIKDSVVELDGKK
jgi:exodeoxyribonuclease V gamma subunit